jgi:hypothetical protein
MSRPRRSACETEVIPETIPDFRPAAAPLREIPVKGAPREVLGAEPPALPGGAEAGTLRPRHSRVPASIQMQLRRDDNNNRGSVIKKLLIKKAILHKRYSICPPGYPQAAQVPRLRGRGSGLKLQR